MNCIVAIEGRFVLRDGRPASHHLTYERFWKRYLGVFDSVTIVGRLYAIEDSGAGPVEGQGVRFHALPSYTGPREFLKVRRKVRDRVRLACAEPSAAILRLPGQVGTMVWSEIRRQGRPYGVEVVADPYDVFAPGANDHSLRPFFRMYYSASLRRQCRDACAASYVTEFALQRRYPPAPGRFQTNYSSVELPSDAFVSTPRTYGTNSKYNIVTVAMLEQPYKRLDVLIEAIGISRMKGMDVELSVIGDGKLRPRYESLVLEKGLSEHVRFHGKLRGGPQVRAALDNADIFVLASRMEGLPRAMIESMARGLPCIGTTVGGIPELLDDQELVPPNDAHELARAISNLVKNPERMTKLSQDNLDKSHRYAKDVLQQKRSEFYREVRDCTIAAT